MVTFRNNNNNRRNNFRRNDRSYKSNGDRSKYGSNLYSLVSSTLSVAEDTRPTSGTLILFPEWV